MDAQPLVINLAVLLVGGLLLAAAATYILRTWERAVALFAVAYLSLWATWLWGLNLGGRGGGLIALPLLPVQIDVAGPVSRAGFVFRLQPDAVPIIVVSMLLAAFAFLLTARISQGRSFVPFTLILLCGYVVLALFSSGPISPLLLTPLFLVALSCISAFILQAGRLGRATGPLRILVPPVLAFPLFLVAAWYIDQIPLNPQDATAARTAAQLISLGILLLLAPVPLHSAQPAMSQSAPPAVTALLTLLYQLALLHLLYLLVNEFNFITRELPLGTWLLWAGIITAVWGGLAAAGADSPGRLWGYAALHDWGLILLVLAIPGELSWPLVIFLFGLRVVSMMTAAAGMTVMKQHAGSLEPNRIVGIGSRLPWNCAAFLLGGLGLAGFPLSAGFTGHWAALQLVAESDWRLAAVVLVASGGAIFGFIQMARTLYGDLQNRALLREQPLSTVLAMIVLLLSASLAVAPQLLNGPVSRTLVAFSG